jgi:aromatic-L-amino-acid decarboxylase
MLTNFDCSAYFVKDPDTLIKAFEIHPEYLKTGMDSEVKNFRDWGVQLGRRFRALKLWFVIRSYGVAGLQGMVREHIRLAEMFKKWVEDHEDFELMAPVSSSLICFRNHGQHPEDRLNELNKELLERLNRTGKIYLTHTELSGNYVLRLVIGQRTTEERHVRDAWNLITETADELQAERQ